jgi:rod shape-determining protein MreD
MNIDFLKRLLLFFGLMLVQALVLNHVHLFGVATPLLYVYFAISFRRGTPKWAMLVWSFLLGLSIDVFSNTPGLAAASMTLVAAVQPYLLELFIQRGDDDEVLPSIMTFGLGKFSLFALILTFVYCVVFFTLESFTFFNWIQWLLNMGTSVLLTLLIVLVVDNLRRF